MMPAPRAFEAARATLTGDRPSNQDRCLALHSRGSVLLAVADGLGGHPRGEIAAQLLIDVSGSLFRQAAKPIDDPADFMLRCIGRAHQAILRFGSRQDPPVAPRTTAVLALIQGGTAHWAHVGDSRLYLLRGGQVQAQTRDHAHIRFVRHSADDVSHPRTSLTRCLGGLPQPPLTTCGAATVLEAGDTLVLCTDGLWGQLTDRRLAGAFADRAAPIEAGLRALVAQAGAAPNSDNVTAVALRWLAERGAGAAQPISPVPPPHPRTPARQDTEQAKT
jgi:serine/threonine protein phosphatase PrpC